MTSFRIALAAAFVLAVAPALAQNAPVASARATIKTISADGATLNVHTRAGEDQTIHLNPKTRFVLVVPADACRREARDPSSASPLCRARAANSRPWKCTSFPRRCAGPARAIRPFDLAPKSSMTNGNISARVDATTGPKLTVTYKGGEQTIVVDPKTPIVAFEPGARDRSQARRGDHRARAQAGGRLDRRRLRPGRQGRARPADVIGLSRARQTTGICSDKPPVLAVQ